MATIKKSGKKLGSKKLNEVKPLGYNPARSAPAKCYVAAVVFGEDFETARCYVRAKRRPIEQVSRTLDDVSQAHIR